MLINQSWAGSFGANSGTYIASNPIFYRGDKAVLYTAFTVHETREYGDPEPFSQLSELSQRSAMQSGIDQLIAIMEPELPELKTKPGLLMVEFWYSSKGGRVVIAKYENGTLSVTR